ncbi:Histidinol phosphate phosphatase HisJ family protein [uncultured delta proteobacterium]|uniref:Histidinol-phosphatase n=1 Tax=uncultured delta proteobacterium TaxID=34034 RepID=A0A212JZY9_9DELT|nr:Histidinol phosphate phosphatase HisJ family protein [uncultured delta proteobacterium]
MSFSPTLAPILVDQHTHTAHSHGKDTVAAMAASAFAKGLKVMGFSEHSPRPEEYAYPSDYQAKLVAGFPAYVAEVLAEKERYAGRMEILLGLEMDYMPAENAFAEQSVAAYPYEYVIGSVHFQGLWGFDFAAADWETLSGQTRADMFTRYYQDQKRMAETGLFQIAGHCDLIKLFSKPAFDAWIQTRDAQNTVRETLAVMKANGMAMEVSSAGIRKGLGEPYPGPVIMRLARELDLPVAFGSDAHSVGDVAFGLDDLAAYAHGFGYTQSAFFRNKVMQILTFA